MSATFDFLGLFGDHYVEHTDKDGTLIGIYPINNGITNQGKQVILDTMFNGLTQIPQGNWAIGLIDGAGTPTLANGDTLASHGGWNENTSYSGNRPVWGQSSSSGQAVTNSAPVTFNITTAGTLYGILVCGATSGTSAPLWSTAAFTAPVPVSVGDQMKVTYTLAT